MRRLIFLALLVPLLAGCGWASAFLGSSGSSSVHSSTTVVYPSGTVNPVPRWIHVEHLPHKAIPGAKLFLASGCTACHVYAGTGTKNLNAPPLTAIGSHHLGIRFEIAHLRCPACVNPGSPMPSFASLGKRRLHRLAVFLEASKGIQ